MGYGWVVHLSIETVRARDTPQTISIVNHAMLNVRVTTQTFALKKVIQPASVPFAWAIKTPCYKGCPIFKILLKNNKYKTTNFEYSICLLSSQNYRSYSHNFLRLYRRLK